MLRAQDLMQRDVVTVRPNLPVTELQAIADGRLGAESAVPKEA